MAFQISLNSTESTIVQKYNPAGINLNNVQYEVGLKHLSFWNSIYNISHENNILHLRDTGNNIHKHYINSPRLL